MFVFLIQIVFVILIQIVFVLVGEIRGRPQLVGVTITFILNGFPSFARINFHFTSVTSVTITFILIGPKAAPKTSSKEEV